MNTEASPSGALPRRFLRPLLLLVLSGRNRSYGYQLAEELRGFGLAIDMAGIYRELRSLEQRHVLESTWEPSETGPDRRVYWLTDEGAVQAVDAIEQLTLARDMLAAALATSHSLT